MDGLFDIKHGISIRGKDYGFIGITDSEIDIRVDEMLIFIDSFKGSAGGTFGEDMEVCIDFPYETLTLDKFILFEKKFRETYQTFDGHLFLHDLNHFTADESKLLDSYVDFEDYDEDERNEGDEWKDAN